MHHSDPSDEQLDALRNQTLDLTDEDGYITADALKDVLNQHMFSETIPESTKSLLSSDDILDLASQVDVEVKGDKIRTRQFFVNPSNLVTLILNTKNIFDRIDNQSGRIDKDKIQSLLGLLGTMDPTSRSPDPLSSSLLMAKLDEGNKGYVTLKDCIKFVLFLQAPTEKHTVEVHNTREDDYQPLFFTHDTKEPELLDRGLEELQQKISMLQAQLTQSENAQIELLNTISSQNESLDSLKKKISEGKVIEEERNNLRESIEKLKVQEKEMKEDIKSIQKREQDIRQERDILQKEYLIKEKELNDAEDEILKLQKQMGGNENDAIKQQLESQGIQLEEMSQRNQELERQFSSLLEINEQLKSQYEEVSLALESAKQKISSLNEEKLLSSMTSPKRQAPVNLMDELKSPLKSMTLSESLPQEDVVTPSEGIDHAIKYKEELEQLKKRYNELKIQNATLQDSISGLETQNGFTQESSLDETNQKDELEARIQALEQENQELQSQVDQLASERKDRDTLREEFDRQKKILFELENEKSELIQQLRDLEQQSDASQKEILELQHKIEDLEDEITKLGEDNREKENQIQLVESQKQQLESLLQSKDLQISKLEMANARLGNEPEEIEMDSIDLSTESLSRKELEHQYKKLKDKLDEDEQILTALRDEIEQLKERNKTTSEADEPLYFGDEETGKLISGDMNAGCCSSCCMM